MKITGEGESVGGEGVSRWRSLVEVRVWEVKVCEQVEITGGESAGGEGCEQVEITGGESAGGEGVSRWRSLEVRVQEVRVCEEVEITGGGECGR